MKAAARRLIVAGAALALLPAIAPSQSAVAQTADKVTVRFTWKLKGEYAPLFVALDKGYYKACSPAATRSWDTDPPSPPRRR